MPVPKGEVNSRQDALGISRVKTPLPEEALAVVERLLHRRTGQDEATGRVRIGSNADAASEHAANEKTDICVIAPETYRRRIIMPETCSATTELPSTRTCQYLSGP